MHAKSVRRGRWFAGVCLALALGACDSGGGRTTPAATNGQRPGTILSPLATDPPPPTPTAPTGSAAATTPPSTSSTTTAPPAATSPVTSTTIAVTDQIKQAVEHYAQSYFECSVDPATCHPEEFLAPNSNALSQMSDYVAELVKVGYYLENDPHGMYIHVSEVRVTGPTSANADACWFDPLVLLGPNGLDGKPTVINSRVESYPVTFDLSLSVGEWRVSVEKSRGNRVPGDTCRG